MVYPRNYKAFENNYCNRLHFYLKLLLLILIGGKSQILLGSKQGMREEVGTFGHLTKP